MSTVALNLILEEHVSRLSTDIASRTLRVAATIVAALALWATVAAGQAQAAVWTAPLTVGPADPTGIVGNDIAMDASGAVGFVWTSAGDVRSTMRRAGGNFGDTATLGQGATSAPAVALDGAGNGLAVWARGGALAAAAGSASRGGLTQIPDLATGVVGAPDVAFMSNGRAIVVWAGTDGAIHALERGPGGVTVLGNLSTGAGNDSPSVAAVGDRAIVAWINETTAGTARTTRLLASLRGPGTGFGAAEQVDVATATRLPTTFEGGAQLEDPRATISNAGAADVLAARRNFTGVPGDFGLEHMAYSRPAGGGWSAGQRLGTFDPIVNGVLAPDLVAGRAGDALYLAGDARGPMTFYAHLRPGGSAAFGPQLPILSGQRGEIRGAALATGRFLAVLRAGPVLRSFTGSSGGFGSRLNLTTPPVRILLDADGTARGEAVAAWQVTTGAIQVALYDDTETPSSQGRPPAPGTDRTRPVLAGLRVAPARFARRTGRGRSARGGSTIRWRLSEAATVRLRVQQARSGYRRGGRCVATRPSSGRVRRCTRFVTVGTITRRARAGRTSIRFAGYVRSRPLAPGRYRLSGQATDAARNASRTRRAPFRVVRRR